VATCCLNGVRMQLELEIFRQLQMKRKDAPRPSDSSDNSAGPGLVSLSAAGPMSSSGSGPMSTSSGGPASSSAGFPSSSSSNPSTDHHRAALRGGSGSAGRELPVSAPSASIDSQLDLTPCPNREPVSNADAVQAAVSRTIGSQPAAYLLAATAPLPDGHCSRDSGLSNVHQTDSGHGRPPAKLGRTAASASADASSSVAPVCPLTLFQPLTASQGVSSGGDVSSLAGLVRPSALSQNAAAAADVIQLEDFSGVETSGITRGTDNADVTQL